MTQDSHKSSGGGIVKRLVGRVRATSAGSSSTPNSANTSNAPSPSHSPGPDQHPKPRRRGTLGFGASRKTTSPKNATPSRKDAAGLSLELWDEAYDALRLNPKTSSLVQAYESIISQELPDHMKSGMGMSATLSDGSKQKRLELLETIATAGLMKRRGSNNSSVNEGVRHLLNECKQMVEGVWDDYPGTAVAWAGVCTMTPLLLETILSKECIKDGLLHATGRIPWYMDLHQICLPASWADPQLFSELQSGTRTALLDLYRKVLEFEMNCICASASAWNNIAKHVVGWHGLPELVRELARMDREMVECIEKYATAEVKTDILKKDRSLKLVVTEDGLGAEQQPPMPPGGLPAQKAHG